MNARACIFGCAGLTLEETERAFFAEVRPVGFILFDRNIKDRDQVRRLAAALRATVERPDAFVLVDQEGGRVRRLRPPVWPSYPPARRYAELGGPIEDAALARLGGRLIAEDLEALGIDVDCAPVLDVPRPDADPIVGDRAFAEDPETAARLGRAFAEGLIAGRVLPVIKHIPGHGRARGDSHLTLPVVDASQAELERDFAPFRQLSDMPMAMTAHVVYAAIDAGEPATTSAAVIRLMREELGFGGLLLTDDLSMKALEGPFERRAERALDAGCDLVLHCNGDLAEMRAVAAGSRPLEGPALTRTREALRRLPRAAEPIDAQARALFRSRMEPS